MCIICRRQSQSYSIENSTCILIDCPSCGKYGITSEFEFDSQRLDKEIKIKLSHLLVEYKLKKINPILLFSSTPRNIGKFIGINYIDFLKGYPKEAIEIMDRVLLNISRLITHPADKIRIDENIKELFFSEDINSVIYIIRQLASQGYTTLTSSTPNDINIEAKGWQKIAELKKKPEGLLNQVFIAMWFDKSVDKYYKDGIEKAIGDSIKYKVVRVDFIEHNNKICDQIIAEINKSKLVIADFTGDRGGVYFEAGYAQGLGIPVIWTVQEEWVDKLHFDTRQYNHIVYKDSEDLYKKLKARIEATFT
jgi:nucleoside 2-deoxyribosyltransferase